MPETVAIEMTVCEMDHVVQALADYVRQTGATLGADSDPCDGHLVRELGEVLGKVMTARAMVVEAIEDHIKSGAR